VSRACKTAEVIPGYTLCERIGAGGYGEVWKADAPGGLLKAVKFVYGCLNEERAAREMKALGRIREVRHPFLLSLERIEVIDGQLVVVTELADASLRDRYEEYRAAGKEGIPREELLVYLRDAADALDYMGENFSLQHLDVKPENLLLVGGRVKVADFGLVKDMQDVTVSLMGGLTPVYAAPEVFDGHPNLHSDQYSLAIVYQEMLSGTLPFPGRTPSQLASQHLHSSPRLTPVPPADRPVLNRALAKDPGQRFPSCRALVDALLQRTDAACGKQSGSESDPAHGAATADTTSAASRSQDTAPPANAGQSGNVQGAEPASSVRTLPLGPRALAAGPLADNTDEEEWTRPSGPSPGRPDDWSFPPAAAPVVEDLPPIQIAGDEAGLRPVLVLGVGGTAARALRLLHQRWSERFGDMSAMPALQMLLLDTDPRTIGEAMSGNPASALDPAQTLLTPLGRHEDYGDAWEKHSRWLNRRWLCNIPRSQRTEGLRPLGRLALVDHAEEVLRRLRTAIAGIMAPDALAESARHAARPVRSTAPSIVLVASVSGGTGSGMVLDLAYAVRKVLAELSCQGTSLCGILTHSALRHSSERMLSILNAYACLREFCHYSAAGYPGDTVCGLPAFGLEVPPFDDTYLIDLGDKLSEPDYQQATGDLAEHLYLATTTAVGALLEKHRAIARERSGPASSGPTVCSVGFCRLACSADELSRPVAQSLTTPEEVRNCWERAAPRLATGAGRRAFVTSPSESIGQMLRSVLGHDAGPSPSLVVDQHSAPALYCEIEGMPLSCVAARLTENCPEYAHIARRLRTRVDLAW
jgi:eukaryotic-like serine/threonine-protein kinase